MLTSQDLSTIQLGSHSLQHSLAPESPEPGRLFDLYASSPMNPLSAAPVDDEDEEEDEDDLEDDEDGVEDEEEAEDEEDYEDDDDEEDEDDDIEIEDDDEDEEEPEDEDEDVEDDEEDDPSVKRLLVSNPRLSRHSPTARLQ